MRNTHPPSINGFLKECAAKNGVSFRDMVKMIVEDAIAMNRSKYIHAWKEYVGYYVELGLDPNEVKQCLKYFEYHYT